MRVLLAAAGSNGDLQPMLALAVALRAAGHEPTIAGPAFARDDVVAHDVPFVAMGVDARAALAARPDATLDNGRFGAFMREILLAEAESQLDVLVPLAAQADVVVGGAMTFGAPTAAEHARVPYRSLCLSPQLLPSAHHPPVMIPVHGLPAFMNRLAWRVFGFFGARFLRPTFATRRRALSMPPVDDVVAHMYAAGPALLAADPELFPPAPDQRLVAVGSFPPVDDRPLPDAVDAFVADDPRRTVSVGFGSMVDPDPRATARLVAEAAARARCRVVLSAGWAGLHGDDLGEHVLVVGGLAHARLFPRVAGVVHHGGAGTTAAAARAGVPQCVVPHIADQFGHARTVHRSGLGPPPLARTKLRVDALAARLARLVDDDAARATAADVGARIRARAPLHEAVRFVAAGVQGPPGLPAA